MELLKWKMLMEKVCKMRNKVLPSEYLAFLSVKYEVDVDSFFNALVEAGKNQKSTCGSLSIEFREKQKKGIVLLITKGSKVVAQFPLSEEFLLQQNNPIKDAIKTNTFGRFSFRKNENPKSFCIKDLRIGMKSVNLKVKVLEIAKPLLVVTRFGNYANVANALVADDTGKIKLCLWNEQIHSISIGDTVHIENARISAFKGERQLRVGKNGAIHVAKGIIAN